MSILLLVEIRLSSGRWRRGSGDSHPATAAAPRPGVRTMQRAGPGSRTTPCPQGDCFGTPLAGELDDAVPHRGPRKGNHVGDLFVPGPVSGLKSAGQPA